MGWCSCKLQCCMKGAWQVTVLHKSWLMKGMTSGLSCWMCAIGRAHQAVHLGEERGCVWLSAPPGACKALFKTWKAESKRIKTTGGGHVTGTLDQLPHEGLLAHLALVSCKIKCKAIRLSPAGAEDLSTGIWHSSEERWQCLSCGYWSRLGRVAGSCLRCFWSVCAELRKWHLAPSCCHRG